MQTRTLGKSGLQVSAISMGTEYLLDHPREVAIAIIRGAIARGVNFFDLFYAQPHFRDAMGEAFRPHRQRVMLTAHLGAVMRDGQYDKSRDVGLCEAYFYDYLTRYHTDYVDVLYLHNVDAQEDYDRVMGEGGLLPLAQRLRCEGKARLIGLSGHTVSTALQAVMSGQVDVLMFPLNLAGHAVPGKAELLNACAARGVGLVAMKPFAGGKLLQATRTIALENWQSGGGDLEVQRQRPITPVQCLAYVLAQVGVSTTVPGARDLAELDAALAYWRASDEEKDFAPHLADFRRYVMGECVYCNHCLPCPSAIDIGQLIRLFEMARHNHAAELRAAYAALPSHATDCVQCGACMERCPFGVDVIGKMEQAVALFG